MANLEGVWFSHKVEGIMMHVLGEVTRIMKREEGTSYSPYININQAGTSSVSHQYDNRLRANATNQTSPRPTPAQAQATTTPRMTVLGAPVTQALPVLTSTATNVAVDGQDFDPTLTAPPIRIQSGDVGKAKGKEITEGSTTIVTSGVFTTPFTTALSNGETFILNITLTGMHTITTTTAVPTRTGTASSKSRPPPGIIGGVIGVIAIVVLALIACCILRRKRRHRPNKSSHVASNAGPPTSTIGAVSSTIPRPFLGTSPSHDQPSSKKRKDQDQLESSDPESHHHLLNGQNNTDPFQDPATIQGQEELVVGARNALDRLQELTRGAEEELRELGNRARRGQLSDSERERLDEIRRTTGLTIVYDSGHGRFSTASSASSYTTSPPSYHSDRS